ACAVSVAVTTAAPGAVGSSVTSLPVALTATQPIAGRQSTPLRDPALSAVSPEASSVPVCGSNVLTPPPESTEVQLEADRHEMESVRTFIPQFSMPGPIGWP